MSVSCWCLPSPVRCRALPNDWQIEHAPGHTWKLLLGGGGSAPCELFMPCHAVPKTHTEGGGGVVRGLFRGREFRGGGISPRLGIPKLRLPHAHPNMQATVLSHEHLEIELPLKAALAHDIPKNPLFRTLARKA